MSDWRNCDSWLKWTAARTPLEPVDENEVIGYFARISIHRAISILGFIVDRNQPVAHWVANVDLFARRIEFALVIRLIRLRIVEAGGFQFVRLQDSMDHIVNSHALNTRLAIGMLYLSLLA